MCIRRGSEGAFWDLNRVVLFYVLRKIRYVITLKDFRRAAPVRREQRRIAPALKDFQIFVRSTQGILRNT